MDKKSNKNIRGKKFFIFSNKKKNKKALSDVIAVLIMVLLVIASIVIVWVVLRTIVKSSTERISLSQRCLSVEIDFFKIRDVEEGYNLTLYFKNGGEDLGGIKVVLLNDTHSTEVVNPEGFFNMKPLQSRTGFINTTLVSVLEIRWVPYFIDVLGRELVCEEPNYKIIGLFLHSNYLENESQGSENSIKSISNCNALQNINKNLTSLVSSYKLVKNIDCSDTVNWNGGQGFEPLGNYAHPFLGTFDGKGYNISGLTINRPNLDVVGLFGSTGPDSEIKNLAIININIQGRDVTGGLVGFHEGKILDSYLIGEIEGNDSVGGLVGINAGSILRSYSDGSFNGSGMDAGGLVGLNGDSQYVISHGKINNSFSIGSVFGIEYAGGLVGYNYPLLGIILNSFWYNHSGNPNECYSGGDGDCFNSDTFEYFYNKSNPPLNSWNFENIWFENLNAYPTLSKQIDPDTPEIPLGFFDIYDCYDLQNINNNLTDSYILMNDIDCSDTVNWNGGEGFKPIGNESNNFNGNFSGNGKIISNLYINRPNSDNMGLFGFVFSNSEIKNFGLVNGNIIGRNFVGGLVGKNFGGTIKNTYSLSSVSGNEEVGLLIGSSSTSSGEVSNSYSRGNVTGVRYIGGLVGRNYGNILNSYSLGNIFGTSSSVGGLVGENRKIISDSYTVSNVSGTTIGIGSLVGNQPFLPLPPEIINSAWYNHSGNPENCHSGGNENCIALNNFEYFYNIENSPMNEWDFENIWSPINNGTNYPVLRWEVD